MWQYLITAIEHCMSMQLIGAVYGSAFALDWKILLIFLVTPKNLNIDQ